MVACLFHNTMTMNKLPPYSIVSLCNEKIEQNKQFWISMVESQLHSAFWSLQSSNGMPTKDEIIDITRETPPQLDP